MEKASRAERRRAARAMKIQSAGDHRPAWRRRLDNVFRRKSFRFALAFFMVGPLFLAWSQLTPHDYGYLELGALFTLSIYDLVLAMLGLSVALARASTWRGLWLTVAIFGGVLFAMLAFFDPLFEVVMATPLGGMLYLIAPTAVVLGGITLWTEGRLLAVMLGVSAAVVAFSFSLFVGLDDLGVGIPDFAFGTLFCALWLLVAPALLLREFHGPWLKIPSRILGSWLLVIAVIVTVSLYVPMPRVAPPPPDLSGETPLGGQVPLDELMPDDGTEP